MEPTAANAGRVSREEGLHIPEFVVRNDAAVRRERELFETLEADLRHNGEIDRDANPDDRIDPIASRKVFENWMCSVNAVPMIERLESSGQLDPALVERRPDWADEARIHGTLKALVEKMLENGDVEAIHPFSRVQYQLSPEELPGRRLAIAFARPEETRDGDSTIISKRALVYDPAEQRFVTHVISRTIGPAKLESRLDLGVNDIAHHEGPAELVDIVSNLRILAESDIIPVERGDQAA